MNICRIILLCFAFFVTENINAQVLTETVTVDGKSISIQKLTLTCGYWTPVDSHWQHFDRTYTLHIIDENALQSIGYRPRVSGLGWYAWSDNSWNEFDIIDENVIWLQRETHIEFGTQTTCSLRRGCRDRATFEIALSLYMRGIERATLDMVVETGNYQAFLQGPGRSDDYEDPVWPGDIPSDRAKCQLLQYRKPPARIGF